MYLFASPPTLASLSFSTHDIQSRVAHVRVKSPRVFGTHMHAHVCGIDVFFVLRQAGHTTAFAVYSTRKMEGKPLNTCHNMHSTLFSLLPEVQRRGGGVHKAMLHVFRARCPEHWFHLCFPCHAPPHLCHAPPLCLMHFLKHG